VKKKHFIFIIQNNNKNKKHIKIKKIKKLKVSKKKLKHEPSLKKPGDFTMAEGHGHPLVIYINLVSLCVCDGGFGGWEKGEAGEVAGDFFRISVNSVCLSIEVRKPRSRMSVCRGPETQIPNCKSKITAQKLAWLLFSKFS
jgi:hypothetical protein